MSNYNPFISAATSAAVALTSPEAVNYYQRRAQEDIDRALAVVGHVYSVCSFVYALGALAGEAHYAAVCTHTKAAEPVQPCLPKPRAIAALPPAPVPVRSSMTLTGFVPVAAIAPAPRRRRTATKTTTAKKRAPRGKGGAKKTATKV